MAELALLGLDFEKVVQVVPDRACHPLGGPFPVAGANISVAEDSVCDVVGHFVRLIATGYNHSVTILSRQGGPNSPRIKESSACQPMMGLAHCSVLRRHGKSVSLGVYISNSDIYSSIVLREPTFLILTALVAGPLHGYGVIRSVAELSDGRVTLRAGTLYTALDRLVGDGSLAVDGEEVVDGRRRRYYRITEEGLEVLRSEVVRLESIVGVARGQLSTRPSLEGT